MSCLVDRAKQATSGRIADTIIDYLGAADPTIRGSKKRCREDFPAERDSIIREFFLNFIDTKPSFLDYETVISFEEFEARDLTRFMTREQRESINLGRIHASKVNEFILKLQTKRGIVDIAADINHYEEFPRLALIGHMKRGDVSLAQAVSIFLLNRAIKQFITERAIITCYELPGLSPMNHIFRIDNPRVLPKISTHSILENKAFVKTYFNLTDYAVDRLLNCLASKPDSEKYYHTIPLPTGPFHAWSPGYHRVIDIIQSLYPVETGPSRKFAMIKRHVIVIPSYSMLEVYSKILYKDDAIPYVPLLGPCTKATITLFKLQDKRPFNVGISQAPTPDIADNEYFGPYGYPLHDFYHGIRDDWFKKSSRRALCHIVDRIFSKSINDKTGNINWALMDGELIEKNQGFGDLFTSARVALDSAHARMIIEDMALLPDFWRYEFFITADKLPPAQKAIYDSIFSEITAAQRKRAWIDLFNYYRTHARKDDPYAQFRLGCMYYHGQGTEVSYPDAIRHWLLSGQDVASYCIGLCYLNGKGVETSRKIAFTYLLRAARRHPLAQFIVGWSYYWGETGVIPQDFRKALVYFNRVAQQGNSVAAYNVAVMLQKGEGCEKDLKRAFIYFQRAAEGGDSDAQNMLGDWYYHGKEGVVAQNVSKAMIYLEMAAKQGHEQAKHNIEIARKELQDAVELLSLTARDSRFNASSPPTPRRP